MNEEDISNRNIDAINLNLVDVDLKFIGDRTTISLIVELIAYIRNAIVTNSQIDINTKIGHNVINTPFDFTVNNSQIKDFIAKKEIEIN